MKLNVNGLMAALLILVSLTWFGCNKCKDVTCLNGGSCDEETGECVCATGYSGADCGVEDSNRKFSGTFSFSDTCSVTGATTYDITFSPIAGTTDSVLIEGIWRTPAYGAKGKVNTDGLSLTVPYQQMQNSAYAIEASSVVLSSNHNTVSISYSAFIAAGSVFQESCSGVGTR